MKVLDKIDLSRHLIVEVEGRISGTDTEYLYSSHVRVHDGVANELVAEFKRYNLIKRNIFTGEEETVSTFDDIILNTIKLTHEDITLFYRENGETHNFVQTYAS